MPYADYSFYVNYYHGQLLQVDFEKQMYKASRYLDYLTGGKTKNLSTIPDSVKNATCAIVDEMHDFKNGIKGVSSETVGRVSRTYSGSSVTEESAYYNAAMIYLSGSGLMGAMIGNAYKL